MSRRSALAETSAVGQGSRRGRCAKRLVIVAVGAVVVALVAAQSGCVRRVSRQHDRAPGKDYGFLATRVGFPAPEVEVHLTRRMAEQDLDELEWLLEHRYSYRDLTGVDYRAALDSIRAGLGDGITRSDFAYQLMKLVALFGDAHTRVSDPILKSSCSVFLPLLVRESGGRLVSLKADRSGLLHPDFPYLRAMDGRPIETWLEAAGLLVPQGSAHHHRALSVKYLVYIECLRKELGLASTGPVRVLLESPDASKTLLLELPLADERPDYGVLAKTSAAILPGDIGYLPIVPAMDPRPEFLQSLVDSMHRLRDTDGLVIDIRQNGGGSRAPLQTLFPFFMHPDDAPLIVNVAAHRMGVKESEERFELRYLHRASWSGWSEAERLSVKKLAATFRPAWSPPEGEFSEWHYFAISPRTNAGYFYYDRPVVVLVDSYNVSACDIFTGALKGWRNTTIIGQPTGGASGSAINYRLRNSDVGIRLSSMASFRPTGQLYDGNGIEPDVYIDPAPTDFVGQTDTTLDAAVTLLSQER